MDGRILPELFSTAYEALYLRSLDDGVRGGQSRGEDTVGLSPGTATGQARVSTTEVTSIGRAVPGKAGSKRVGKTAATMRDERAYKQKQKIDKRLRRLGREIMMFLADRTESGVGLVRICTGRCKKFGDAEWAYCAHCGGPMREVDGK